MNYNLKCYRVTVPTTNYSHNTYHAKNFKDEVGRKEYEPVVGGKIYVIADHLIQVASWYPDAILIEHMGVGSIVIPTECQ